MSSIRYQADEQGVVTLVLDAPGQSVNTMDGPRITLKTGDVVHYRPSGNAPELRQPVAALADHAGILI